MRGPIDPVDEFQDFGEKADRVEAKTLVVGDRILFKGFRVITHIEPHDDMRIIKCGGWMRWFRDSEEVLVVRAAEEDDGNEDEKRSYIQRLVVANAYKRANGNSAVLPPDDEFEAMCRNGVTDVEDMREAHAAHDRDRDESTLMRKRTKKQKNGTIGITLLPYKTGVRVSFEGKEHGTFRDARNAAEKYNELAKAKYGDRAVINDNMAALDRLQAIVDEHRAAKDSKAKTVERCKKAMNQAISQSIAGRGR